MSGATSAILRSNNPACRSAHAGYLLRQRTFLILLRLCAAGYAPGNRENVMASFVFLKSGGADVLVNVENVNFLKSHGQTSTVHFTGGQDLVINVSASEAFGMMQDAKQTPAKQP